MYAATRSTPAVATLGRSVFVLEAYEHATGFFARARQMRGSARRDGEAYECTPQPDRRRPSPHLVEAFSCSKPTSTQPVFSRGRGRCEEAQGETVRRTNVRRNRIDAGRRHTWSKRFRARSLRARNRFFREGEADARKRKERR